MQAVWRKGNQPTSNQQATTQWWWYCESPMLASSRAPGPLKAVSGMMSSTTGAPNSFSSHAIKAGAFPWAFFRAKLRLYQIGKLATFYCCLWGKEEPRALQWMMLLMRVYLLPTFKCRTQSFWLKSAPTVSSCTHGLNKIFCIRI